MYVKYIVLDGFKSYRDITRIGPFDPHFNAITGLNGSGKSNVLDGICFVLGISSMSVVRCKSLADCIYTGHGETLTKASVSIILDNTDKTRSPPGQEHYDEIIVSRTVQRNGECRYYINKTSATKRGVTDLFESVQLNVNNPNFMIMQGKITKVVNMKPKEILHMIEEAVGATLYQAKREKAEVELRNKQLVIDSTNSLIMEHIKPSLDKQSRAHEMIQEYNVQMREKNDRSIEYAIAHYAELQARRQKAEHKLAEILKQDAKDDELAQQFKEEIKELKHREEQMKKESTSKFKDKVDQAEKVLQEEKKKLHTKETDVKTAKEAVAKAKQAVKEAEKTKHAEEKQVEEFKKKSANSLKEFEQLQEEKNKATFELEKAREQENQLRSGKILDDEGKSMDIDKELNSLSSEITSLKPEVEDFRQRVTENRGRLGQLEKQLKQTPSDDQIDREYNAKAQAFETLRREAARRNINAEESVMDLQNNLDGARRRRENLIGERRGIMSRNYALSLNWDKNRVSPEGIYGCIYDLVKANEIDEWGNALELAVGGIFGHVVVETDTIAKNLVQHGQMQRRTYVHPLNVFKGSSRRSPVTQDQLDRKFGPGNAIFAKSLLEYDRKFENIIENYVGTKVLCKDIQIGRKIAFELHLMAYTVGGEVVDPGGVMQGGTRQNLGRTIRECVRMFDCNQELRKLEQEMQSLQRKLEAARSNEKFVQELEKAKRELHNAEEMKKLTKYSQLKAEIDQLKASVQEDGAKLQEKETLLKNLEKQRAQLAKKADQADSLREKNIRDNANLIKKWEKALEAATKKYESRQKYFNDLEMDLRSKQDYLNGCQKDIDDAMAEVQDKEQTLAKLQAEVAKFMEHFEKVQQAYDNAVAESNEWFEEAKAIQEQIKALDQRKEASEINKMKRNNDRKNYKDHLDYAVSEIQNLEEKFQDINFEAQRPTAGKSATALKKELDAICKKLEDMQQRLDHEAAAALENTQREYDTLMDKLKMIEKNKNNLIKAIQTLDESKKQKVKLAYEDVNSKFNDMMQTLLPEARAKLVEVTPGNLSDGVNIHVQLGGVWKESLTELSGGQRSLVALSLVLSLCMYNPAPFYILDEVDAALDLSHTQNIGVVIQRQFKGTQFICVSLKDGMFSNANVLFTAKHEGGRSVVTRSARINRAMPPPPPSNPSNSKKNNKNKK